MQEQAWGRKPARRALGEDDPVTLYIANKLGIAYKNQSRYDEAKAIYLDTLERQKRTLGEAHPDTAVSLYNLAQL